MKLTGSSQILFLNTCVITFVYVVKNKHTEKYNINILIIINEVNDAGNDKKEIYPCQRLFPEGFTYTEKAAILNRVI